MISIIKLFILKLQAFRDIKSIAFADIELSCNAKAVSYDMNQSTSGNIGKMLAPFTNELNMSIMSKAVKESKSQVPFNDEFIKNTVAYASAISCSM
jgi:hypothetical protein